MIVHTQFPWRKHNAFRLLVDSDSFYPNMLQAIARAEHIILLEQYLVSSGTILSHFIQALRQAAQRGVQIYIIFDDYGASAINASDRLQLQHTNIHILWYNPFRWLTLLRSLRRDHRKLMLIDHRLAYVGGAGLTDHYMQTHTKAHPHGNAWHDVMLEIRGEVVNDWYDSFCQLWNKYHTTPLADSPAHTHDQGYKQIGQVLLARGPGQNQIIRSAIRNMRDSRKQIWIATPYFVTTRKLRHTLKNRARHGIDVRLLLPGPISDHGWISQAARRYYTSLLRNGVRIYEYQPRFIHAKIILVDDWVSVGSCNLDSWSQFWNLDANQAVRDQQLVQQAQQMLAADFQQSRLISLEEWKQRPHGQRLREWWSSYVVRTLRWLVYFYQRTRSHMTF